MVRLIVMVAALGAAPQLSPLQRDRLTVAVDGADHRDDAFAALVEHVRQWTGELGDVAIRLQPRYEIMRDDPAAFRGELCRIAGTLEQITQLPSPYEDVQECFIRTADGVPALVYVVARPAANALRMHEQIEIDGWFYNRVNFTARDGKVRGYPAFVGAFPRSLRQASTAVSGSTMTRMWIIAGPIAALFIVLLALRLYVGRRRARASWSKLHGRSATLQVRDTFSPVDGSADLPDDPADALAELKRRASN